MPSPNQRAADDSPDYDSEPEKMVREKDVPTLAALIRGIRDVDRAQAYVDAEIELADEDGSDPRSDVVGACYRKISELGGG